MSHAVGQLLLNAKECKGNSDEDSEEIESFLRDGALSAIYFFQNVTFTILSNVLSKPEHIVNLSRNCQHQIGKVSPIIESLVKSSLEGQNESELGAVVEKGFLDAQRSIEEAATRLSLLILTAQERKLDVHSSLLVSAQALTKTIMFLIVIIFSNYSNVQRLLRRKLYH